MLKKQFFCFVFLPLLESCQNQLLRKFCNNNNLLSESSTYIRANTAIRWPEIIPNPLSAIQRCQLCWLRADQFANISGFCLWQTDTGPKYLSSEKHTQSSGHITFTFTYTLTRGVIGTPQMTSQPVSSIFLCSPPPSGTWQTPGLSIPWGCSVCLVFFPLSLCLARWFWPDLIKRLKPVWNNRSISLSSNMQLMRALVTSIFLCACESRTLTAELQRRIRAMEMRCNRKILRISNKDCVTDKEVCAKIQQAIRPYQDLLSMIKATQLKWQEHGHG